MNLQLIFGMTMANLSMCLLFGCYIMIHLLKNDTPASITIPSIEQIIVYKPTINSKYPILKNVWATMDGLKLYLQKSPKQKIQEIY